MALVYLFFAIGFVSAPEPHPHLDCNHDPQHCIQVALVTTDPKECEHIFHELHDCQVHVINHVCGTDQNTYPNKCELAKARCQTLKHDHGAHVLALAHEGSCSSTTQIHGIDPNLSAVEHLTCTLAIQQTCAPNNVEVICGSNGLTYHSFCEYHKAHCAHATITMSHFGPCQASSATTTGIHAHTTTVHIISSNKTTTPTPVTSTTTVGTTTNVAATATTPSMQNIIVNVFCQYVHSITCNTNFSVVCGSDGLFYPNECDLSKAYCSKPGLHEMPDLSSCSHTP